VKPRKRRHLKITLILSVLAVAGGLVFACPLLRAEFTPTTQASTNATLKIVGFSVEGMTCGSCVASVKRALQALDGVTRIDVSLADRRARVQYVEGKVTPDSIAAAVRQLGYKTGEPVAGTDP